MRDKYRIVIEAMLKDDDFFKYGCCFSKAEYYMKKYNISKEEMYTIEARLYWALLPAEKVEKNNVNW